MSVPIVTCVIYRAARGDTAAFNRLVAAMKLNQERRHFSIYDCQHTPPCTEPSAAELAALDAKVSEAIGARANCGALGRKRRKTPPTT